MSGKSKVVKTGKMTPVRGGPGKMFGKQHVGTQTPGQTASKSGPGGKWAKGGATRGGGQGKSSRVVAGRVSVAKR
jgi:hypothetical protein